MDNIRNKLKISDCILPKPYWNVTKSGKVLELRVLPNIDQDPEKYRLGVIQIGRIISRIQTLTKHSGAQPQIQLFPNLTENQLAATVYWPNVMEDLLLVKPHQKHRSPLSGHLIKRTAKKFGLTLSSESSDSDAKSGDRTFYIVTKSNQPFVWLKVGQFIQSLTEQSDTSDAGQNHFIEVSNSFMPETGKSGKKVRYRQAKISIQSEIQPKD